MDETRMVGTEKSPATFYHIQPVLCWDEQTVLLIKPVVTVSAKYAGPLGVGQKLEYVCMYVHTVHWGKRG